MTGREKKRAEWGAARQAFLVLAPSILADLDRSVARTKVYAKFKDRLGMSYSQFCYWVKTYRQKAGEMAKASSLDGSNSLPHASASLAAVPGGHKPLYSGPPAQRTFHFDPMDAYRKEFGIKDDI